MAATKDAQLDGLPIWAKVGATLTAISIVSGLCVFLVVNLANNQENGAKVFERLIDKFDTVIEKHDTRQREWMLNHGDRIREENAKTRETMTATNEKTLRAIDDMTNRQEKAHMEFSRALETQTLVLKQIRDEKKMP